MNRLTKKLSTLTLILLFTSFTFGCQAKEEIAQNNIVSIVDKTGGRTDINNDGRIETILIEKDEKLPGIIKKLVILNDKGEPIFYLFRHNVPGYKSHLALYCGVKDLEGEEKEINGMYYMKLYDIRYQPDYKELPKIKEELVEERAWVASLSPSGRVDLETFEKRVERLLAKMVVLYRSGAITGGSNYLGYKVTAGVESSGLAYIAIVTTDSEGKPNIRMLREFIWDTKTDSYVPRSIYESWP